MASSSLSVGNAESTAVRAESEDTDALPLISNFLNSVEADQAFHRLRDGVEWRQETLTMFGQTHRVPRLISWQGEEGICYRYAGRDHLAHGWSGELKELAAAASELVGQTLNFVLLNRYRDGADCMGWHSDDEAAVAGGIVSISLGASRRFSIRRRPKGPAQHLQLEHGSALIMPAGFQDTHQHRLPRTRKPVGERINLTFRTIQA